MSDGSGWLGWRTELFGLTVTLLTLVAATAVFVGLFRLGLEVFKAAVLWACAGGACS